MEDTAERVYRTFDEKESWGDGPWQEECDKLQWKDPATGLDCLAVRNRWGNWCGYVGVTEDHPAFEKAYSDDLVDDIQVHGGLTYADHCQQDTPEDSGICHVPAPGEPDHVWWFGFDTGHAGDYMPAMAAKLRNNPRWKDTRYAEPYNHEAAIADPDWFVEKYRTLDYVRAETTDLAAQLAAIANG